jgi:hypothetical protein
MSIHFFKIERRSIFHEKWGDHGDILQHGMTLLQTLLPSDVLFAFSSWLEAIARGDIK